VYDRWHAGVYWWLGESSLSIGLYRTPTAPAGRPDPGASNVSTITTFPRSPVTPFVAPFVPVEERGVMRGVSWNFYDRLTDAMGERSSIRVAFDGKDLEIMVVGPVHEGLGDRLGIFVGEVCDGLDLDFHGLGSTTWKRAGIERGIEADLCFCFDPEKVAACRAADVLGSNDGTDFPIPDLAVEIDISPPKIDRPGIYSGLRVAEVWRFRDGAVSIEYLDANGSYVAAAASRFLHVTADEVTQWLNDGKFMQRLAWKRSVRDWARAVLKPRAGT
jgi:Uma2 family endonuclease